jgi:hypothetical protein
MIVLTATGMFLVALVLAPRHGLLRRWLRAPLEPATATHTVEH